MDLLAELEAMALNFSAPDDEQAVTDSDAERWQYLFGYTPSEAVRRLEEYRNDFARTTIPEALWETVRTRKEAEGYDREAYEYSLTQRIHTRSDAKTNAAEIESTSRTYIMKLAEPLDTPESIQAAAGLDKAPPLVTGMGESGEAGFCQLDAESKARLVAYIAKHHPDFQATIVRLATKAKKDLSSTDMTPCLDTMTTTVPPVPAPDQYPVWYFFYGTLADPDVLSRQLGLDMEPALSPAHIEGARIRTWGGKYKALVSGSGKIDGSAYLVETREHEDALRFYETDKYEVVRCNIVTSGKELAGLTFRFAGEEDDLD